MRLVDASSMLAAWDTYPIQQFPRLWTWMAGLVADQELVLSEANVAEVGHKSEECASWLREHDCRQLDVSDGILQEAMRIKGLLGIVDDKYSKKGVDENDLICIATARFHGLALISDEALQLTPPANPANSKIPRVCSMPEVQIHCMSFREFLTSSGAVF
ncbi:DUF4411 family protein [Myxococcota bacterium]|nr:DUF4411 family protein [Myxococcota bacterium]